MRSRDTLASIFGGPCLTVLLVAACSKAPPAAGSGGASSGAGKGTTAVEAGAGVEAGSATDAGADRRDSSAEPIGEPVASNQLKPSWLSLDGENMYWILDARGPGAIVKKRIAGGTTTEIATGLVQPDSLRIDGTSAYWLAYGEQAGIHKVSLAGGTVTDLVISAAPVPIRQIAIDSDYVYWTDGPRGSVFRVDKNGGTPSSFASGLNGPSAIAIDASGVYVIESGEAGAIVRIPSGGGAAVPIAEGQAEPQSLVLTAQDVYWVNGGTFDAPTQKLLHAGVMGVSKAGGPPREIVAVEGATALSVDGSTVYYAAFDSLMRAPAAGGGAAAVIANGQASPRSTATDATYVYWTNAGTIPNGFIDGDVRRMKK